MRGQMLTVILIVISLVTIFLPTSIYSKELVWLCSGLALLICILFLFKNEKNENIRIVFFRPSFLFIFAYVIVFFQRPFDYSLGYSFSYTQIGDLGYMMTSLKWSLIGLCLFCIGYQYESKRKNIKKCNNIPYVVNPIFYAVLSSIMIGLVFLLVPREVLMGGYSNDMLTNASIYNYLASWSNMILIAYIVQFTINAKVTHAYDNCSLIEYLKGIGIWQNMNVLVYSLIVLNVGDRGPIIVLAFAYYISYIIVTKRNLSKVKLTLFLCLGIFLSSLLGDTKKFRDNNTILDRLTTVFENKSSKEEKQSFLPATDQLASSYCCLPIALQLVPEQDDYTYGISTIGDVISSIPFSGRFIPLPQSSSSRISEFAMGKDFTFGLGTNCIAALYMDGGFLLIVIGMFIFGILLRKFEVCVFSDTISSFFTFCMAFYFLTRVIYIPRSTLLSPFKYAFWMYIMMFIYVKIASNNKYVQ